MTTALAAGVASFVLAAPAEATEAELVGRGREVYIAEGSIHCHSQFHRPGTADVERWGPAQSLSEALQAEPPLFGNRRQGPDLTRVGQRRTPEWNRLHLMDPRSLVARSRMPSYAHLFARGDDAGPALVAYLASLGTIEIVPAAPAVPAGSGAGSLAPHTPLRQGAVAN